MATLKRETITAVRSADRQTRLVWEPGDQRGEQPPFLFRFSFRRPSVDTPWIQRNFSAPLAFE
ncbi:hypothetical protein EYF80_044619 [Liparis tanakae]|uniref:Uncharacterized protein n=1 Tax=Liparis tanakae TaxID=230148 RepID=A0A4Z2FVF4_9TELE|nr:hypothetical protein EYF80_044619 [Liparis tanakae]